MPDKFETKTITISLDAFDMILEALGHTQHMRFLNDDAKQEYKDLLIELGGSDYFK
ncbi:hypothetical protein ACTFSB_28510 [Bacillus cereus group sp. MYBK14-3]|uniref:hypothetical protein n=1 Tax=unclassified Bacillus cereus group TaxID=2750818 RepID=UPI003F7A0F76